MLRILIALFLAFFVVLLAALFYLPTWGFLLVLGGCFLALMASARWLTSRAIGSLFSVPFRAKGMVLTNAAADVHSVARVAAPASAEGLDDGEQQPLDYFEIDVTITPRPSPGPFHFWEPGELALVPAKARVAKLEDHPERTGVSGVEVFEDGKFGPDEGMKYFGKQRLRLTVGVPQGGERTWAFLYYFSKFGKLTLPPIGEEDRDGPRRDGIGGDDGAGRPDGEPERTRS
jgi:hypothetical protein